MTRFGHLTHAVDDDEGLVVWNTDWHTLDGLQKLDMLRDWIRALQYERDNARLGT